MRRFSEESKFICKLCAEGVPASFGKPEVPRRKTGLMWLLVFNDAGTKCQSILYCPRCDRAVAEHRKEDAR